MTKAALERADRAHGDYHLPNYFTDSSLLNRHALKFSLNMNIGSVISKDEIGLDSSDNRI